MEQCARPLRPKESLASPTEGSAITLCSDGTYRWTYAFSMYKNPVILFTISLNEGLKRNQTHVAPQDFDFALRFIRSHIPEEVATKLHV